MSGIIRQGDVVLIPVATVPATATPRQAVNGRHVLAFGEVTGHAHSIAAQPGVAVLDAEGLTYLTIEELVGKPVELEHQEHTAVPLAPRHYEVRIQREWSDAEEPIQVQD